ncbi:MAG: RDD family protein [Bdellovibrionota bacterium]
MNQDQDFTKTTEIKFKPLSEGLGFHPFSDGLPYAPITKTGSSVRGAPVTPAPMPAPRMGTGATAAGPARFVNPRAAQVSVPRVTTVPQRRLPEPVVQVAKPSVPAEQENFGALYLLKRASAYLVDSLVDVGLCLGALSALLWKQDMSPDLLFSPSVIVVAILFLVVFNWSVVTAQEVMFGTTLGKRLFGLRLQGSAGAIFFRAILFPVGAAFAGLGVFWSLLDSKGRGVHDVASGVQPLEIARL